MQPLGVRSPRFTGILDRINKSRDFEQQQRAASAATAPQPAPSDPKKALNDIRNSEFFKNLSQAAIRFSDGAVFSYLNVLEAIAELIEQEKPEGGLLNTRQIIYGPFLTQQKAADAAIKKLKIYQLITLGLGPMAATHNDLVVSITDEGKRYLEALKETP